MSAGKKMAAKVEATETEFTLREKAGMFFEGIWNFLLINRFAMACLIAFIFITVVFIAKHPWYA